VMGQPASWRTLEAQARAMRCWRRPLLSKTETMSAINPNHAVESAMPAARRSVEALGASEIFMREGAYIL